MPIVTVKNKFQVVIPASVRKQIQIKVGDILEARCERGGITFTPKSIMDREIAESLNDYRSGNFHGPFRTANEMIDSLNARLRKRRGTKPASRK